eukprot:8131047-Pyramimonas_sp.AAC.1
MCGITSAHHLGHGGDEGKGRMGQQRNDHVRVFYVYQGVGPRMTPLAGKTSAHNDAGTWAIEL